MCHMPCAVLPISCIVTATVLHMVSMNTILYMDMHTNMSKL